MMSGETCTNPPPESCSDAGCPAHGAENTWGGTPGGHMDTCPDCGRAGCTGEDCYWPDEAGLR